MKNIKKIKLLSSLSTVASTISLVTTSCAIVKNGNHDNKPTPDKLDINEITWVTRSMYTSKYNDTAEKEIINKVKNDNQSIFDRYQGLEESTAIFAEFKDDNNVIVEIKVTDDETYENSKSWTADYVKGNDQSEDDELILSTSTIKPYLYLGDVSTDATVSFEYTSGEGTPQLDASKCTVTCNGKCLTVTKGNQQSGNVIPIVLSPSSTNDGASLVTIVAEDQDGKKATLTVTVIVEKCFYAHTYLIYGTSGNYYWYATLTISPVISPQPMNKIELADWLWSKNFKSTNKRDCPVSGRYSVSMSSSTAAGTFYGTASTASSNGNFETVGYGTGPNNIRVYTLNLCSSSYPSTISSTIKRI